MKTSLKEKLLALLVVVSVFSKNLNAQVRKEIIEKDFAGYLFAYFSGNKKEQEQVYFA
ncbi:hypothetical protein GSB9_00700 [Flavobacteriaceae bacterium GSB9]|nr:hypothetical protein GSB9_00700 [Flavobacteriaceae bacterium GSB9]